MLAPAARARVANVCRNEYGGRRSRPTRSRAGYQTRRRQLSRLMWPPIAAGNSTGPSDHSSACSTAPNATSDRRFVRRLQRPSLRLASRLGRPLYRPASASVSGLPLCSGLVLSTGAAELAAGVAVGVDVAGN